MNDTHCTCDHCEAVRIKVRLEAAGFYSQPHTSGCECDDCEAEYVCGSLEATINPG
jgi:hypothetical protein